MSAAVLPMMCSSEQHSHQSIDNQSINTSTNHSAGRPNMTNNQSTNPAAQLPSLRRQVSTLQLRNDHGRTFLRLMHQPTTLRLISKLCLVFNVLLLIGVSSTLILSLQWSYVNLIFSAYLLILILRTMLMLVIHSHCLLADELYINRHSVRSPASLLQKLQRWTRITLRILSFCVLCTALVWFFSELENLPISYRYLALCWIGVDLVMVLGEWIVYLIIIQLISYKVVSFIAPFVPISKQSLLFFQCEQVVTEQKTKQRAGLDKKQLKQLKQSQHCYEPTNQSINSECSICLLDFELKEKINTLRCHHSFHTSCISTWLRQRGTCPLCITRAEPLTISNTKSINQSINLSVSKPASRSHSSNSLSSQTSSTSSVSMTSTELELSIVID